MKPFALALLALGCATAPAASAQLRDPTFNGQALSFNQPGTSGGDDGVKVIALESGGYLAIGSTDVPDPDPAVVGIAVARLLEAGFSDPTFRGQGRFVKNAGMTSVHDASLSVFNEILVTGGYGNDSALVRFNPDGTEDTTLAGDGGTVFDASGAGQGDFATSVADVGGSMYVAGSFDSDPGPGIENDAWLGRVDRTSGALTVLRRRELDTASDVSVAVEEFLGPTGEARIAWLSDSKVDGQAGVLDLFLAANGQAIRTIHLDFLLTADEGCAAAQDARSVALVPLDTARIAVVGNLIDGNDAIVQAYVIVVDLSSGSSVGLAARCGPAIAPAGSVRVNGASTRPYFQGLPPLHLALTVNDRLAYWRWAPDASGNYAPDPTYNGGNPFIPAPNGSQSLGRDVAVDPQSRPVLIGTYNPTIADRDFALARLHANERIFRNGFAN